MIKSQARQIGGVQRRRLEAGLCRRKLMLEDVGRMDHSQRTEGAEVMAGRCVVEGDGLDYGRQHALEPEQIRAHKRMRGTKYFLFRFVQRHPALNRPCSRLL